MVACAWKKNVDGVNDAASCEWKRRAPSYAGRTLDASIAVVGRVTGRGVQRRLPRAEPARGRLEHAVEERGAEPSTRQHLVDDGGRPPEERARRASPPTRRPRRQIPRPSLRTPKVVFGQCVCARSVDTTIATRQRLRGDRRRERVAELRNPPATALECMYRERQPEHNNVRRQRRPRRIAPHRQVAQRENLAPTDRRQHVVPPADERGVRQAIDDDRARGRASDHNFLKLARVLAL